MTQGLLACVKRSVLLAAKGYGFWGWGFRVSCYIALCRRACRVASHARAQVAQLARKGSYGQNPISKRVYIRDLFHNQ